MNLLSNNKYDVFISYSRKDYETVEKFCFLLQHHNISYWLDKEKIDAELFKVKIVKGIESSRVFIFFSSENSNRSEWTEKEIAFADKKKKTIIPVKLDNSPFSSNVQFDLVNRNSYNFTYEDKKRRKEVTKGFLRAIFKEKGKREPYSYNEEQIDEFLEGLIQDRVKESDYWKKFLIVLTGIFLCIISVIFIINNKNEDSSDYDEPVLISITEARKSFDNLRAQLWHQISDENTTSNQIEKGIESLLLLHNDFFQISLDSIQSEEVKQRCLDEQQTYQAFQDSVKLFLLGKAEELRAIERNTSADFYEESANKLK